MALRRGDERFKSRKRYQCLSITSSSRQSTSAERLLLLGNDIDKGRRGVVLSPENPSTRSLIMDFSHPKMVQEKKWPGVAYCSKSRGSGLSRGLAAHGS
jgi:hypothetical protein